jgi:hypothetical protein
MAIDAAEMLRLRKDFRYFCESQLKINPKIKELVAGETTQSGPLIPFRWNKAQNRVWNIMLAKLEQRRPIKLVVLKARQVGISTFFCAYIFWRMWRQQHYRAGIVAFEKQTTLAELNETFNTFRDSLPEPMRPALRQHRRQAGSGRISKNEVYFADRKCKAVFSVQKENALRGLPLEAALCTEVSFYKNADEFFGGFVPAMSDGANALLVLESSPADGWFRDEYEAARDGETDRTAIFIPWWMCDDIYSRPLKKSGRKLIDVKTGDAVEIPKEMWAKQRHLTRLAAKEGLPPITDAQIWWWWHYCLGNYKGDEAWMLQEFPDDDITAFQKASRSAFKVCLDAVNHTVSEAAEIYPEMAMGLLHSTTYLNCEIDQAVYFEGERKPGWLDQETKPGFLMIEPPRAGFAYIVGADVADAEGEDDEEGERAFSVGCVYCCQTREQVAEWRGHIDPTDWGDELCKIGYFYNTALLVVERNNMGRLTEHRIKAQLKYPMRFRWPDFNVGPEHLTKKEMWETTGTTKPILIGAFRQWVRDGLFKVRSEGLADEMAHYRVKNGKFESQDRAADRIIAAALCVQGVEQTEFAYKNIVLGGSHVRASTSAGGMAMRVIRMNQTPPSPRGALPAEFEERMGLQKTRDIFTEMGLDEKIFA